MPSICRSIIERRSCSPRSAYRRRLELLPHAGGHAEVRLRLLRQAAHVGFLGPAQPLFDLIQAVLARRELRGDERGCVFRARLAGPGAGLHEDARDRVGDALRLAGCRASIGEQKRIELQSLARDLLQQLGGLHLDAIGLQQPIDRRVDVAVWRQVLFADDLLEHRPAQELLRDRADALFPGEWPGLLQQARPRWPATTTVIVAAERYTRGRKTASSAVPTMHSDRGHDDPPLAAAHQ